MSALVGACTAQAVLLVGVQHHPDRATRAQVAGEQDMEDVLTLESPGVPRHHVEHENFRVDGARQAPRFRFRGFAVSRIGGGHIVQPVQVLGFILFDAHTGNQRHVVLGRGRCRLRLLGSRLDRRRRLFFRLFHGLPAGGDTGLSQQIAALHHPGATIGQLLEPVEILSGVLSPGRLGKVHLHP